MFLLILTTKLTSMKTTAFVLFLGILLAFGCSSNQSDEIAQLKKENAVLLKIAGPPPAVLDSLYPPVAPAPLYLLKMHELGGPLSGMAVKIMEGDRETARALFNTFREQYASVSEMVPEWKADFPLGPLDELDGLIEEGDPGAIMEAFQKVGEVCHQCHLKQMPKVQQKYHWPEFSMISLTDPLSNKELEFRQFMMSMELSVMGMMGELQMSNIDAAIVHMDNFKKYLDPLKESCYACHNSERKYYVDENVDMYIANFEQEIRSEAPNPKSIEQLGQLIGQEMCFKCHLVHVPATYAKSVWQEMEHSSY
jgi:mono/diheme cytochrome c family protein